MGRSSGVIEINGSRYNAVTGDVIGTVKRIAKQVTTDSKDRVIDGFVKSKAAAPTVAKPKPASSASLIKPLRVASTSAKAVHHRTQRPHTLMRNVVAKPSLKIREAGASFAKTAKASARIMDSAKASRAKLVSKHSLVNRFGVPSPKIDTAKAIEAVSGEVLSPKTSSTPSAAKAAVSAPLPSMVASASHQRLERILDEALLRADAHKQSLKRSRNRLTRLFGLPRWASIALIFLVLLIVGAIIAWREVPAVAVRLAAARSHLSAAVPAYTPAGFSFNKAISKPGSLSIEYRDKLQQANTYTVTQQKSNLDSQSLSENSINKNSQVQTSQVGGTTVYIYGASENAKWVNNGSLYTITNKAGLSSDQILHIVQGL